jgi:hypothetical protein
LPVAGILARSILRNLNAFFDWRKSSMLRRASLQEITTAHGNG